MTHTSKISSALALCVALGGATAVAAQQAAKKDTVQHDARARTVAHDPRVFGPDPDYSRLTYNALSQDSIYGAKHMNPTQRPLLELGRDLYDNGPFSKAGSGHNILIPQLLVYGDLRVAAGTNTGNGDISRGATRLNLDIDFKITASERIHVLFRPLEKKGQFTRFDFKGDTTGFKGEFDGEPAALFFEGDLGAILGGFSGKDSPFDMPIAAGLMPLLFHNGIWIEDAFIGGAFTIPARNSKSLDWSNFDITFFGGATKVSNPTVGFGNDHGPILGVNAFVEVHGAYIEAGYANIRGSKDTSADFHSVALSHTKRYNGKISNSFRYIGSFGKEPEFGGGEANGHLFLIENSLITSKPSTFVPYLNVFLGLDSPVSAARDAGAGGILKNTGLNFEPDAITGLPALNASGQDAVGGAFGLNMLGSKLNRQLVLEVAGTFPIEESAALPDPQFGVGVRMQQNLNNAIILRLDGMYGIRGSALGDISGARIELRYKF